MHSPPGLYCMSECVALTEALCVRPPNPNPIFRLRTSEVCENPRPAIFGALAELLLDAQQAIILG